MEVAGWIVLTVVSVVFNFCIEKAQLSFFFYLLILGNIDGY